MQSCAERQDGQLQEKDLSQAIGAVLPFSSEEFCASIWNRRPDMLYVTRHRLALVLCIIESAAAVFGQAGDTGSSHQAPAGTPVAAKSGAEQPLLQASSALLESDYAMPAKSKKGAIPFFDEEEDEAYCAPPFNMNAPDVEAPMVSAGAGEGEEPEGQLHRRLQGRGQAPCTGARGWAKAGTLSQQSASDVAGLEPHRLLWQLCSAARLHRSLD